MYRVWKITEKEKGKIVRSRWYGDTYYYDVYDSQEECDEDQKRIDKIDREIEEMREDYIRGL